MAESNDLEVPNAAALPDRVDPLVGPIQFRGLLGVRRMNDGRAMVFGFVKTNPLPDGVNDARVLADVMVDTAIDVTAQWRGKTFIDLMEDGLPLE